MKSVVSCILRLGSNVVYSPSLMARRGPSRHDMAWRNTAGMARHGLTRQGVAWRGTEWQGRRGEMCLLLALCILLTGCANPLEPSSTLATLTVAIDTNNPSFLMLRVSTDEWLGPVLAQRRIAGGQSVSMSLETPQILYVSVEATEYGGAAGQRITFDRDQVVTLRF